MKQGDYFDALETRDPELREREQLGELSRQIAHAKGLWPRPRLAAIERRYDQTRSPEEIERHSEQDRLSG